MNFVQHMDIVQFISYSVICMAIGSIITSMIFTYLIKRDMKEDKGDK